jgi:putative ABC transport system ATP-binding protein
MLINAVDLRKNFRDRSGQSVAALSGLSLQIEPGEFAAVTGPSGCGKSTLLNILGLLEGPDAGRYLFDGQDVSDWPERRRAELRNRRIGFVFQSFHLLPFLTVRENVELPFIYCAGNDVPREKVPAVLASVGLGDKLHRYPTELSGGEQQRVAIARALVMGAELILADEPTGNLDAANVEGILDLFDGLVRKGKTVVLVTHDPNVAARARRRIRLERGAIVPSHDPKGNGQ